MVRTSGDLTPGVIGGLGPEATLELLRRVLRFTPSEEDQDHIPVLLYNNPRVPSRTKAVLEGGPSPEPALVAMAQKLQQIGADFLVLPCNSAHLYLSKIRQAVDVPVLSMLDLVREHLETTPAGSVGLLATTNTVQTGLYDAVLAGREVVLPQSREQAAVMAVIADVKAGRLSSMERERCFDLAWSLVERGATTVVLGCTELSLIASGDERLAWLVDPLDLLAQTMVDLALGHRSLSDLQPSAMCAANEGRPRKEKAPL